MAVFHRYLISGLAIIIFSQKSFAQALEDLHAKALQAITDKQYPEAIHFASKAIAANPANGEHWHRRGYAYFLLKKPDSCINDCSKAIELLPKLGKAYIIRARAFILKNNYQKAGPDYQEAYKLNPELFLTADYTWLGYYQVNFKQYEAAIKAYSMALQKDSSDPISYLNRGIAYQALQQNQAALTDFAKCIKYAPEKPFGYQYRAELLDKTYKYKEAIDDWTKLTSIEPTNAFAAARLAHSWYNYGSTRADARETNAITEGRIIAALKLNPKDATLLNIRGLNRHKGGYNDELAIQYITEAINLSPNEPTYYNNRGYVFAEKGKYTEAIADYDKAMTMGGKSYQPFYKDYRAYATKMLAVGPTASAQQMHDEALRLHANNEKTAAIALMNKAIAKAPNDAKMYFGGYKVGPLDTRIEHLKKANELDPKNPKYVYFMGFEFYLKNKEDLAIKAFDLSMKLGGQYLIEENKKMFGNNYKQNILNKRNPPANGGSAKNKSPNKLLNAQEYYDLTRMVAEEYKKSGKGKVITEGYMDGGNTILKYKKINVTAPPNAVFLIVAIVKYSAPVTISVPDTRMGNKDCNLNRIEDAGATVHPVNCFYENKTGETLLATIEINVTNSPEAAYFLILQSK